MVAKVTCDLPLQDAPQVRSFPHLQNIQLADPTFCRPGLRGGPEDPIAMKTVFGWAVMGKYSTEKPPARAASAPVHHIVSVQDTDAILIASSSAAQTAEENLAVEHYTNTHVYILQVSTKCFSSKH